MESAQEMKQKNYENEMKKKKLSRHTFLLCTANVVFLLTGKENIFSICN